MMRRLATRQARGSAAVELALVVLAFSLLLPFWWRAGRSMMQYGAIRAAAFDAANLIAHAAPSELASSAGVDALEARAEAILVDAIAANGGELVGMDIDCLPADSCVGTDVQTVRASVTAVVGPTAFADFGSGEGNTIMVLVETSYGGRTLSP